MSDSFVHESAIVDEGAIIGKGTKVWHFCHILSGGVVGDRCSLGQNVMIAGGAVVGNNVKIQNNVAIYDGVQIDDDVFLGPSCVFTNVKNPRSQIIRRGLYEKTIVRRGATIGANATIVCGVTLGRYSFVGAGAVVSKDIPDYGFVIGVPGEMKGWMSRHGHRLNFENEMAICAESGYRYRLSEEGVKCLDLDEEESFPVELNAGTRSYDEFKKSGKLK